MKIRFSHALPLLATIVMAGSTVFAAPGAPAAPPKGKMDGQRGPGRMQKMVDSLGLTAAQKTKMKAIMDASRKERKALHDDTKLTPDQKKAKMKTLREGREKKMSAVLTPAQRKKFMAMMKEQHDKMGAMGGPKKP